MHEDDYIENFVGMSWFKANNQKLPTLNELKDGIYRFQEIELEKK